MKLGVLQEQISAALSTVVRAIDTRPVMPVLANVLLEAEGDDLVLTATNQEMTITTRLGAQLETEGAVTIPAKELTALVSNMSGGRVDLDLDESTQRLTIKSGRSKHVLAGIAAAEYPPLDSIMVINSAETPTGALARALREVSYAAGSPVSQPISGAVQMKLENNAIRVQAFDNSRGAITRIDGVNEGDTWDCIVPIGTARELAGLFKDDAVRIDTVTVGGNQQVKLRFVGENHVRVLVTLVSGNYPDLTGYTRRETALQATVNRQELVLALRRASAFAPDNSYSARITFGDGGINISGTKTERGSSDNFVEAEIAGEAYSVWIQVKYLLDALSSFDGETVVLSGTHKAPHLFVSANSTPLVALIARMGDEEETVARNRAREEREAEQA